MRGIVLIGTAVTRADAVGSLYRITADGEARLVEGLPRDVCVQAITPDPADPDRVWIAARKGVYRSDDCGATWVKLDLPDDLQYWSLLIDPADPAQLYVGTSPVGVLYSKDGGQSWTRAQCDPAERYTITFGASRMMKLAMHPTDPRILYGAAEINGMYLSVDGGATWARSDRGIGELARQPALQNTELTDDGTEGMYDAHAVATTPARPDAAFYVCRMGLFETVDRGDHMRDLEVRRFAPFRYSRDLKVDPQAPETLWSCFSISSRSEAGALYRSADLGETWVRADPQVTAASTIMGFGLHVREKGGIASVTRHGQVFDSFDDGANWRETQLPPDAGDAFCAAVL